MELNAERVESDAVMTVVVQSTSISSMILNGAASRRSGVNRRNQVRRASDVQRAKALLNRLVAGANNSAKYSE